MAMQESNETKFFAWLKTKVTLAQCQEMQKTKSTISMLLMQKKVIKRPLFSIDNADEVANIISKVAPCFASSKTKTLAVQMITMYATYLKERTPAPRKVEKPQSEPAPIAKSSNERVCLLHVGDKAYSGETPTTAFAHFCEEMAVTYPLKIRSLVGIRIRGRADVPLKRNNDGNCTKMANVNAYIDNKLLTDHIEDYTRWICGMCGVKLPNISVSIEHAAPVVQEATELHQNDVSEQTDKQGATDQITPVVTVPADPVVAVKQESAVAVSRPKKENPLLSKMEQIVLRADMDGMSYETYCRLPWF